MENDGGPTNTIQICTDISLAFMVAVVVKMVVVFISMGATGISIFFLGPVGMGYK